MTPGIRSSGAVTTTDRTTDCLTFAGTQRANYDDAIKNGNRKGEKHRAATITEATARLIKTAATDRTRLARDIAREFQTTIHVVHNIRNGKTWTWL